MRKWWNKAKDWWKGRKSKAIQLATGGLEIQPTEVGWIYHYGLPPIPGDHVIEVPVADITIVMKGPDVGNLNVPENTDWGVRSSQSGVFYANNFSYPNREAYLGGAHSYTNETKPEGNTLDLETTIKKSGTGSSKHTWFAAEGANESGPNWRFSFDGLGANTVTTKKTEFYLQYSVYVDQGYVDFTNTDGGIKQVIIFDPSTAPFADGEIVQQRMGDGPWPHGFRVTSTSNAWQLLWDETGPTGTHGDDTYYTYWDGGEQSEGGETDRTDVNLFERRWGPRRRNTDRTDTDYANVPQLEGNKWYTFEVYVNVTSPNSVVKCWWSEYGTAPVLMFGQNDSDLSENTNTYRGCELLSRAENTTTWVGADTFICFDEVICSDDPIDFPGGFSLPNPGLTVPANWPPEGASLRFSGGTNPDPTWFKNMSEKVWTVISTNVLENEQPSPLPPGTTGIDSVMQAWNGGVVVPSRFSLVLPACGGHGNYAGNEVYEFRLNQASPAWYRLTDPSPERNAASYADGTPSSHHSYALCVVDGDERVWLPGLAFHWQSGNTSRTYWNFDFDTMSWTEGNGLSLNGNPNGSAAYHSGNGHIYQLNRNSGTVQMGKYNTSTDVATTFSIGNPVAGQAAGAVIDPDQNVMMHLGENGFMVFDISTNSPTDNTISGITADNKGGLIYDVEGNSGDGALYTYGGGQDITKITVPADLTSTSGWSEASVSGITGANPGTPQGNGTFGRFNMVTMPSGARCIIVVHTTDGNVYGLKVPAAGL